MAEIKDLIEAKSDSKQTVTECIRSLIGAGAYQHLAIKFSEDVIARYFQAKTTSTEDYWFNREYLNFKKCMKDYTEEDAWRELRMFCAIVQLKFKPSRVIWSGADIN